MKIRNLLTFFLLLTSSCSLEPKYQSPKIDLPFVEGNSNKKILSQVPWQEFFKSPALQNVVQMALDNNRDLKIAALNIDSLRTAYDLSKADLFPAINAIGSQTKQGLPSAFSRFAPRKQFRLNAAVTAYELDFFGRIRSLKKSALEKLLASKEAQNLVKIAIITETINAYTQLLLDEENFKISKDIIALEEKRCNLIELRNKNGISSKDEFLNALAVLENARLVSATYENLIQQDKNALMLLIGKFDEKLLPKNVTLNDIKFNEDLINFTPSTSMLARPDIAEAEHNLKSANANIGAARAAFFPAITLSGNFGYSSSELSTLFGSQSWSFTPQINLPIFNGGRNIANLKNANILKQIEIIQYEKTIQTAFKEALDHLAERKTAVAKLQAFNEVLDIRKKSYAISKYRYQQGINSTLDFISSKNILLTAKQNQALAQKEYIANLVSLYKVLGGGSKDL
jgi:multidrug efflux system outer membrane protein